MPQKFIESFKRIDELIAQKTTGNPAQLADKLDISESTLYEFLKVLKDLGAPVEYDHEMCSYIYKETGQFKIAFYKSIRLSLYLIVRKIKINPHSDNIGVRVCNFKP